MPDQWDADVDRQRAEHGGKGPPNFRTTTTRELLAYRWQSNMTSWPT